MTETIRALPGELVVGIVSSNTGSEAQFQLFGFRSDHIDILETYLGGRRTRPSTLTCPTNPCPRKR